MKAAFAGKEDDIRRLLMRGENPNMADKDGNTSLHYLVKGFHKLLDRAALLPGLLSGDRTVGSSAEFDERIATFNNCLILLLGYGALFARNGKGETAAHMASTRLTLYLEDPYNASTGARKEWRSFVNSIATATSEYSR